MKCSIPRLHLQVYTYLVSHVTAAAFFCFVVVVVVLVNRFLSAHSVGPTNLQDERGVIFAEENGLGHVGNEIFIDASYQCIKE